MITSRFESPSISANVGAVSPPFQGSELEGGLGNHFHQSPIPGPTAQRPGADQHGRARVGDKQYF